MTSPRSESGYALVAAVASIAVFATMALTIMTATRASVVEGTAEVRQAQAAAAADAGVALAISGLLSDDIADRWSIDGRTRRIPFGQAMLNIHVEDERGKVPLNRLDEHYVTALLEAFGLSGDRLRIAIDSLLDWTDDDDEPRPFGAEAEYYAPRGIRPRNGALLSVDELGLVRGFDPLLVRRIGEIATTSFGNGSFDARYAQPLAIGIMQGGGENSPAAIDRARELAGQRTAIELATEGDLVGRPLTIVVDASLAGGGRARRRAIIELTGAALRPYVVRSYD